MKRQLLFSLFVVSILANAQGTWKQKANFPGGARWNAIAFAIGNKGYLGTGSKAYSIYPYLGYSDFWEYDPTTDTWTQKSDYGGGPMKFGIGFSIGNKGYAGIGGSGFGNGFDGTNEFWEYDPATNLWTQKASMPGPPRYEACAFVIGSKGYVATGTSATEYQDMYEYDPATNLWTQKANFPPQGRYGIDRIPFVIGSIAYLGLGGKSIGGYMNDMWAYDASIDSWTQKANFPGVERIGSTGFAICGTGYVGFGSDGQDTHNDLWKYDPSSNMWSVAKSLPATQRGDAPVFILKGKAYVGTGQIGIYSSLDDFWEFTPDGITTMAASVSSNTTICHGESVQLTASGGDNYSWSNGETSATISVSPDSTTTYYVVVSNICGSDKAEVTVKVEQDICLCSKEELFIPNAFSPNGDQENDVVKLFYGHIDCIKHYKFSIYNRWGAKVFETTNPLAGWDGYCQGKIENTGVFSYSLYAELGPEKVVVKKGNVFLAK